MSKISKHNNKTVHTVVKRERKLASSPNFEATQISYYCCKRFQEIFWSFLYTLSITVYALFQFTAASQSFKSVAFLICFLH